MSAEIIQLPIGPERSCVNCIHYRGSEHDTRCGLFDVQILSERVAASDCDAFDVGDDDGT